MSDDLPVLQTERLVLRPYSLADASSVQQMCGDRAIAATTLAIPHPYPGNPASGRVMQKLRMTREGLLRQYVSNRETYEDMVMYSILRAEFKTTGRTG